MSLLPAAVALALAAAAAGDPLPAAPAPGSPAAVAHPGDAAPSTPPGGAPPGARPLAPSPAPLDAAPATAADREPGPREVGAATGPAFALLPSEAVPSTAAAPLPADASPSTAVAILPADAAPSTEALPLGGMAPGAAAAAASLEPVPEPEWARPPSTFESWARPEPEPASAGCRSFDLSLAGLGSLEDDLARTAGLAGVAPRRPGVLRRPSSARPLLLCDGPPPVASALPDPAPAEALAWAVVPPASYTRVLSGWADDRNDGALFSGKGLSSSLTGGLRARWRWFTAQLAPTVAWQQNAAWGVPPSTAPGLSPYANPFNSGIDLPLQMGPGSFSTLDPGQSFLRADLGPFAAGLSTENLWWGPGIRNSLLLSNSAAGFPHAFAGTSRPVDVWIGWLEAEVLWGQLRESRWFTADRAQDPRLFEGVILTFAPAFDPDLTFGVSRAWLFPTVGAASGKDWLRPLVPPFLKVFDSGGLNGVDNQLAGLFARWVFPSVRFELYGEWARDDFAFNLQDFLQEPGHSSAWLLGLQKVFPRGGRWYRVQAELAHTFEMPPNNPTRGTPVFYTHGVELQGYTQRGQMIGAGLGPQGDTQFLAVDGFWARGSLGGYVERIVRNERWFYDHVAATGANRHDLQVSLGGRGTWAFREWDLSWDLALAHRFAPNFGAPSSGVDGTLRVAWWPGRTEAPALPAPPR